MTIAITDKLYEEKMKILTALHEVADPELGINIVDLGLVYGLELDANNKAVNIEMTLSTPSCPLGGLITSHVKIAVDEVMPGFTTNVNLVWEPRWNYDRISEAGRAELDR